MLWMILKHFISQRIHIETIRQLIIKLNMIRQFIIFDRTIRIIDNGILSNFKHFGLVWLPHSVGCHWRHGLNGEFGG